MTSLCSHNSLHTHTHTHTHCTLSIMHYLLTESQFTFHPVSDTLAIVTVVSVSSVLTLVVCEPLDQNHHMHTYYQDVLLRVCASTRMQCSVCVCSRNFVAQYIHKFVFI